MPGPKPLAPEPRLRGRSPVNALIKLHSGEAKARHPPETRNLTPETSKNRLTPETRNLEIFVSDSA